MSKSAIAALTEAQNIIAKSGVTVNLVGYVADKNIRKNWRNANALAALIINSAANAFQCENSETLGKDQNWFKTMDQAVTAYIDSNLDQWNQKEAAGLNLIISLELVRLEGMVNANMNFEAGVAAAAAKKLSASLVLDPAEAHDIANEVQHRRRVADFFGGLDYAGRCAKLDADHVEALAINEAYSAQLGFYSHTAGWQRMIIQWAHEDALKHDAHYQAAIVAVADNLSQPVWEGASDTVKAQVVKHQRALAEEGTGTIEPLVVDYAPNVQKHMSQAAGLQGFWSTLNEYQKEFLLNVAHDEALAADAELASLARFRLPIATEADRCNLDMKETRSVALNEIVSGASREKAMTRFVGQLSENDIHRTLMDSDLPSERRDAYIKELKRRYVQPASEWRNECGRCNWRYIHDSYETQRVTRDRAASLLRLVRSKGGKFERVSYGWVTDN